MQRLTGFLDRKFGSSQSREDIDSDKTSIFIIAVGYDQHSKCLLLNAMKKKENSFTHFSCRTSLYEKKVKDDYTMRGRNVKLVQTPSLNTPAWQKVRNQLLHEKEWTERCRVFVYVREADASNADEALSLKNLKEAFPNVHVVSVDCYKQKTNQQPFGLNRDEVPSTDENFPFSFYTGWDWSSRVGKARKILEQIAKKALTQVSRVEVEEGPSEVGAEKRADTTQGTEDPSEKSDLENLMATVDVETDHRPRMKEKLTQDDWDKFQTTLRFGSARSNHVRVNVVGNHGVGKTTVIKRLLMKEIVCPDVPKPTENLEIHRLTARCSEKDGTKTWETDDSELFLDDLNIQRMAQAMQQTMRDLTHSDSMVSSVSSMQSLPGSSFSSLQSRPDIQPEASFPSLQPRPDSPPVGEETPASSQPGFMPGDTPRKWSNKPDTAAGATEKQGSRPEFTLDIPENNSPVSKRDTDNRNRENESDVYTGSEECTDDTPTSSHSTRSNFFSPGPSPMSVLQDKENYLRKVLYHLELLQQGEGEHMYVSYWDYAGQSTYYATHQLFLSPSAVYLLVVDLRKDLTETIEDNLDFRAGVLQSCTVADAIKFWVQSIQAYTKDNNGGYAPFIVVGTHQGDIKDEDKIKRKFNDIRDLLKTNAECIAIDNTLAPEDDQNLIKLRNKIIDVGLGVIDEKVSSQWINLEWDMQISEKCKDGYIRLSKLQELDKKLDLPMLNMDRLEAFLCHQHYRGHLLFYQHPDLKDLIVTDPMLLVDFLNCIFRRPVTGLSGPTSGWNEDGILNHEYILKVGKTLNIEEFACMTLLNILVKLHILHPLKLRSSSVGFKDQYFMPCLLKDKPQEDGGVVDDCSYSPMFQITFDHDSLYQTTYHQIVCALMKRMPVIEENEKKLIYNLHASLEIEEDFVWLELSWKNCKINFRIKDFTKGDTEMSQHVDDTIDKLKQAIQAVLFVNQHNGISYEFLVECPTHGGCFLKLEQLKKKRKSLCSGSGQGRHKVDIDTIPAVAGNTCEEQKEDPELQQKPDDTVLARLAWKLKTRGENARTLAVLLNLHIAYAKADIVTRDYDDPGSELFHILHSWRSDRPSNCTCSALLKLLTKNGVYDHDTLKAAMFEPQCADNRFDGIPEQASTDNKDIVTVSDHVGNGYTFMLLEVGVKWTEIQMQRQNYRNDTCSMIRHLLKSQRRSVPGDLTTKKILQAAKMIEVPLEPVISKLKPQHSI